MSFKVGDLIRPKLGRKTSHYINISNIKVARIVALEDNPYLRIEVLEGSPQDLQVIVDNREYKFHDYKARNYSENLYSPVTLENLKKLGGFLVNSQSFIKLTEAEKNAFELNKTMDQSSKQVPLNEFLGPKNNNLMLILALT